LKKIIAALIIAPFILALVFVVVLMPKWMGMASDTVSVGERFALSSSIKSPYGNTVKGSYQYVFAFCGDPHLQAESDGFFPQLDIAVREKRASFVIFGGDLTYLGKADEYRNFVNHARSLTVPAYPAIGNHDLYNGGWESYWRYLGPSSYSFYGGNAKFIVIDTASGEIGVKQMQWITKELKSNKQPLLIVISHMPIYGGSHGRDEFPKTEERTQLIELFEKYGVKYVLEGHRHAYVDITVHGVRYITSGSFSEGILDSGQRHFLLFHVYGPNVSVETVNIETGVPIQYRDGEI